MLSSGIDSSRRQLAAESFSSDSRGHGMLVRSIGDRGELVVSKSSSVCCGGRFREVLAAGVGEAGIASRGEVLLSESVQCIICKIDTDDTLDSRVSR